MYCYQCEQTSKGTGCTDFATCGKDEDSAVLQDLLIHAAKGIAQYHRRAGQLGARDAATDHFLLEALFTTVTNVNFDAQRIAAMVREAARVRDEARERYQAAARQAGLQPEAPRGPCTWQPAADLPALLEQGRLVSVLNMGPTRRDCRTCCFTGSRAPRLTPIMRGSWATNPRRPTISSPRRWLTWAKRLRTSTPCWG
jgi:hydroxylamine reductase